MKANTGSVKLCNVLFPIWILIFFPPVLAIVIPGNLIVDAAVLLLALAAMRHRAKGAVLRRCWWKVWLLGFAADLIGAAWMVLGWLLATWLPGGAETLGTVSYTHLPRRSRGSGSPGPHQQPSEISGFRRAVPM